LSSPPSSPLAATKTANLQILVFSEQPVAQFHTHNYIMAARLSDAAGGVASQAGGATGMPLGSLTGALQGGVNNLLNTGMGFLDRWFPPEKREELKNKIIKFASERPKFAAFLLSQIALSGIPLALFVLMSITVLVFALLAGLLVGVLGAVLFTVFCVGLALIILLPTLFITTFAGTFIFLWGLGAYYIVKWFNQKEIPGIHTDAKGGMQNQMGLDGIPALNGQAPPPSAPEKPKREPGSEKKDTNANAKAQGHGDQKESKPAKRSETPSGKGTGSDHGPVGDVKKTAGGVTSGLGL
jgi:Promethin